MKRWTAVDRFLMWRFLSGGLWLVSEMEFALAMLEDIPLRAKCYMKAIYVMCRKYELGVESAENDEWYRKGYDLIDKWLKEDEDCKEWLYVMVAFCLKQAKELHVFTKYKKASDNYRVKEMREMYSELYDYVY